MESRALRGVPWVLLAYAAQRGITLLTLPVLARLLTPADFGVVALATLAIALMTLFRDFGLGGALVLRQDRDPRVEGTMLTIVATSSVVIALGVAALAPLAADAFRSERLEGVLRVLSVSVVLLGIAGFHEMLLQRELAFRARFVAVLASSVTYAAVSIILAATGAGVWSIVVGQIASAAVLAGLLVALAPYRLRFAWDGAAARSAVRAGSGFILQGSTAFIRQNADFIAVGRVLGSTPLGFYSMGYRLGDLPNQALAEPVARVTFPAFARARAENRDVAPQFVSVMRLIAIVVTPLGVLLGACAEPLTLVAFGEEWRPLVPVLTVFGLWAIIRPLETTLGWLVNSVGDPGALGRLAVVLLVPLVPALFLAAESGGLQAVVWVMVANDAISLLAVGRLVHARIGVGARTLWRVLRPVAFAAPISWGAAHIAVGASSGAAEGVTLAAGLASGLAAYTGVLVLADRSIIPWVLDQTRRMLSRDDGDVAPERPAEIVA